MAGSSIYPGALDNDASLFSDVGPGTDLGPGHWNNTKSAIEAIEATLGVNPQGAAATVAARIAALGSGGGSGSGGDAAWTVPALGNGWAAYGGSFLGPRYRKIAGGLVVCEGLLSAGTLNAAMFTLAAGYRPGSRIDLAVLCATGIARLWVDSSGTVTYTSDNGAGSAGWFSLSGASWYGDV